MGQTSLIRLFIDWGFTRLKLWIYDGEGKLLSEQSIYTKTLAKQPAFYFDSDLDRICTIIKKALYSCPLTKSIHVYTSSQMHALAGSLNGHADFVSTWNDLPNQTYGVDSVPVSDGIPVLNSMPVNKIRKHNKTLKLSSLICSNVQASLREITSLSSPINLVLQRIFQIPVPCSRSWWQSTCLPRNYLSIENYGQTCYLSESPVIIQSRYVHKLLGIDSSIIIYPEVGDLQAATYSSVHQCQVLLNLGTGSQVIMPSLPASKTLPYFRYYNKKTTPIPTLSHVPCGRLLADYVKARNISFKTLGKAMKELTSDPPDAIHQNKNKSLLCYPGFSSQDCNYHQQPTTTLMEIASLRPDDFLRLWVFQYFHIIEHFLLPFAGQSETITIRIIGELGGLADGFSGLLVDLLPPRFQLCKLPSQTLPCSLLRFHDDSMSAAS